MPEEAQKHLSQKDPILNHIIATVDYPAVDNTHDVFEDVCSCILDMRIHYAPSHSAFRYPRLKKLIDGDKLTPQLVGDMPDEIFLPLKLSHQKKAALQDWAYQWNAKSMDKVQWPELSQDEVKDLLLGVKGLSEWTAQIILLFTLEHPDILPSNDYQLRKACSELYGWQDDHKLEKRIVDIAADWRPFRSLACRYLWRWRLSKSARRP